MTSEPYERPVRLPDLPRAEVDEGVFRWDGDTIRVTVLGVLYALGSVATGFLAPWYTTVFVSGLTGSWFVAERGRYWRGRQVEQLRGGSMSTDGESRSGSREDQR